MTHRDRLISAILAGMSCGGTVFALRSALAGPAWSGVPWWLWLGVAGLGIIGMILQGLRWVIWDLRRGQARAWDRTLGYSCPFHVEIRTGSCTPPLQSGYVIFHDCRIEDEQETAMLFWVIGKKPRLIRRVEFTILSESVEFV